jgi:hypothetical protein
LLSYHTSVEAVVHLRKNHQTHEVAQRRYTENIGVMGHLSDGEPWKVLDNFDADFTSDVRNVRIGLAMDGFSLFSTNATSYSCWPVFAILYNLPPSLCIKYEFTFLCLILPGSDHPDQCLNVILKPLIEELK